MSLGYGYRARVGHLYPSGGLCDYELQLMAPDGVQFVTTRLPFRRTGVQDDLRLTRDLEAHSELLADADVGLIAVNCTAATMLIGPEVIRARIRAATGIESVTTIEGVMAALAVIGAHRLALLTPYPSEVVEAERSHLGSHGIEVVFATGLPCQTPVEQAAIPSHEWLSFARRTKGQPIDAILISCAGVQVAPVIANIEDEMGVPVIASNQALLWHVLKTLGLPDRPAGYGSLLAGLHDDARAARQEKCEKRHWSKRYVRGRLSSLDGRSESGGSVAFANAVHNGAASVNVVTPLLALRGIHKRYGPTRALAGVDFDVRPGEVHALLGQNGSGKSTLMKVAFGEVQPDAGEIVVAGSSRRLRTPHDALHAGVAMVPQELPMALDLSVAENILLGSLPRRGPIVDWRAAHRRAAKILSDLGSDLSTRVTVRYLAPRDRQIVAIAHALAAGSRVLIFDEPTSSLSVAEAEVLFKVMRRLRAQGVAMVFITQRLREVASVADRVTVLRDGRKIGECNSDDGIDGIAELVAGTVFEAAAAPVRRATARPLLRVSNLADGAALRGVDLTVAEGEIVGVAGLLGCGRTELLRTLFGAGQRPASGEVTLHGQLLRDLTPTVAIRNKIALVTADRSHEGLLLERSIHDNLMMVRRRGLSLRVIDLAGDRRISRGLCSDLGILAASIQAPARTLSGGNQQKVVLGKWLASKPVLLLLDEPTRGIDVAAKADFYKTVTGLAANGLGVVIGSLDNTELLEVCQRILVMREGRVVADLDAATTTDTDLLLYASGVEKR